MIGAPKDASAGATYPLLYADPPWPYRDKALATVGAERHYPCLAHHVILAHLDRFAASSCALACWMTEPDLPAQFRAFEVGGWRYRTRLFSWVKIDTEGAPRILGGMVATRSNVEACYLWTRGSAWPRRVDRGVSQVIVDRVREHSRKPGEARARLERLYGPIPRIELYARMSTPGWDVWGDQVGEFDPDSMDVGSDKQRSRHGKTANKTVRLHQRRRLSDARRTRPS